MKQYLKIFLAVFFSVLVSHVLVLAFTEPSGIPPNGNVAAPITTGTGLQSKAGDLEVGDLTARGGITLGGVRRTSWPDSAVATGSCAWEGVACRCAADSSSLAAVQIVSFITCNSGKITDWGYKSIRVTSDGLTCSKTAPTGCDPALYKKI